MNNKAFLILSLLFAGTVWFLIEKGFPEWDEYKASSPIEVDNAMIVHRAESSPIILDPFADCTVVMYPSLNYYPDTSVCWVQLPCDSNALYKWHVKEIQKLQKARLWKSKPKAKPEPELEIDTALLREFERQFEARRGIDWDYTSPLNHMEFQNERPDDTWILTCDTCPAVKKRDYYKYGANWNLGYTKRPASLDSAIKKAVDSLNKRRLQ